MTTDDGATLTDGVFVSRAEWSMLKARLDLALDTLEQILVACQDGIEPDPEVLAEAARLLSDRSRTKPDN